MALRPGLAHRGLGDFMTFDLTQTLFAMRRPERKALRRCARGQSMTRSATATLRRLRLLRKKGDGFVVSNNGRDVLAFLESIRRCTIEDTSE